MRGELRYPAKWDVRSVEEYFGEYLRELIRRSGKDYEVKDVMLYFMIKAEDRAISEKWITRTGMMFKMREILVERGFDIPFRSKYRKVG